jgi:catechol 2,3-dioxygenase-like lactoylglutathione lyase family enzyme
MTFRSGRAMTSTEDLQTSATGGEPVDAAPLLVIRQAGQVSAPPRMLHHLADVTHDVEATVEFYTHVLGLDLVSTVIDDTVPSTGDPFPYIHLFFELSDGSTIAFFESLDLPPEAPPTHPAYAIFNHLALDVGTPPEVDRWAAALRARGIDVLGPVDHRIIYSIYFHDPNGLRLELTATTDAAWKDHKAKAAEDVAAWTRLKERSRSHGDSRRAAEWIRARREQRRQQLD